MQAMPDFDILAIFAVVALVTVVLRSEFRLRHQTGRGELARIRLLSDRSHREDAMPFE
jgi:hypothetical protein